MTITSTHLPPPTAPSTQGSRRSPGRTVALVLSLFLLVAAAGALGTAGWLTSEDHDRRDGRFLTSDEMTLNTSSHALAIEDIDLEGLGGDWLLGRARLRVTGSDTGASVFVGIARADDAADYLRGVDYATVSDVGGDEATYVENPGETTPSSPADAGIWVAQASGPGTQSVTWTPTDGSWTAVIMNADATGGVDVRADVGATVPVLEWVICGLWISGGVLALLGIGAAIVGLRRRRT